jgi:hypothetical protein
VSADGPNLEFFSARGLTEDQVARWRDFAARVPWTHYRQDPAWAETERYGSGISAREPWYFWAESDGEICLTAAGVRRRLPVPGYVFWEFNHGPVFLDNAVLDAFLPWLLAQLSPTAARVRIQPSMPLDAQADDVETILDAHGWTRRRTHGIWTTLLIDIMPEESLIVAGFRDATQRAIKKSRRLGVEVHAEDTPEGWRAIADLQAELSLRAPVITVDAATIERISLGWLRGGAGGTVLVARHEGEAIAAGLVVVHRDTAYLPVIPSTRGKGDLPASHLLVWEAILWAKAHGCANFDLVGYGLTAKPGDPIAGINQFKRGFASLYGLHKTVAVHEIVLAPTVVSLATRARRYQSRLSHRSHDSAPPAQQIAKGGQA